jgi:hypothetical protein
VARYTRGPAPKLNLTAAELQLLHEWNAWDTKLFDAVKVFLAWVNFCAILSLPFRYFTNQSHAHTGSISRLSFSRFRSLSPPSFI